MSEAISQVKGGPSTTEDKAAEQASELRASGEHQREARRRKAGQIIELLQPHVGGREVRKALSIGAGFGFIDEEIKQRLFPQAEFISTDVDETRLFSFEQPSLNKIAVSATDLDFPDESFDFILAHQVLEHINAYPRVLEKMAVMCKKGGLIYINVPNPVSPALGKIPDGTWPKPLIPAFVRHNVKKFKKDFLADTEKYHTGFTLKRLRGFFKDFRIIDVRKERLRQEVRGGFAHSLVTLFPSFLLFLIVESNIWVCIKE